MLDQIIFFIFIFVLHTHGGPCTKLTSLSSFKKKIKVDISKLWKIIYHTSCYIFDFFFIMNGINMWYYIHNLTLIV